MLAARNCGDWSGALNALALSDLPEDQGADQAALMHGETDFKVERRVSVMIDGPYGGSSVDFAGCENVLMISGGSGVTFALGLLDDLVGRIANERRLGKTTGSTRTRKITFVWCVRSFGEFFHQLLEARNSCIFSLGTISWFAKEFQAIAQAASDPSLNLRLDYRFFVTCFCNPSALPAIHNSEVVQVKPVIRNILDDFMGEVFASGASDGGVGVTASGPERLTSDTRNAVAGIGPLKARRLGGVELHTEAYTL